MILSINQQRIRGKLPLLEIVLSLCAMKTLVLLFSFNIISIFRNNAISVRLSNADVYSLLSINCERTASSKNKTGGSLRRTLETANRCFSPPEIINPRTPTLVSYPSGRDAIVASISAFLATATTSSSRHP